MVTANQENGFSISLVIKTALSRVSLICILPARGAFCEQGTAHRFSSLCSENVPRLRQGVAHKIHAPARSIQIFDFLDSTIKTIILYTF